MRCPKCGYISFDHLDNCLKCNKDISETAEKLQGSVYNVAAPSFLKFQQDAEDDAGELDEAFFDEDDAFGDEEIRDPDLDILMDDEEGGESEDDIEFSLGDDEDEDVLAESAADEDGDINFELDSFGDDADLGGDDLSDDEAPVNIALPDELSDMTDLGPPAIEKPAVQDSLVDEMPAPPAAEDDIGFDFDLDAEDVGEEEDTGLGNVDLADLSLDDMGFDDEPAPVAGAPKKPESKKLNIDDDFDFELDLGDLKLDDDENL